MPNEPTKAAEISVVTHLLHDLRYPPPHRPAVEKFVDDVGLGGNSFQYKELARFYTAVLEEYALAAPKGNPPVWEDIMARLERSGATEKVIEQWKQKHRDLEHGRCPNALEAAKFLVNVYIAEKSKRAIEQWSARLQVTAVRKQVAELCDALMTIIASSGRPAKPSAILQEVREAGWAKPMPTGYSRLDRSLAGGWRVPWLVVCAAPSEHGKTSLACNFANRRAEQGLPTLINSFELCSEEILVRMLCDLASVPLSWAKDPGKAESPEHYQAIMEAQELMDQYIRIYDKLTDDMLELTRRTRRHQLEFNQGLGLNIIDHIGLVPSKQTNNWSRDAEGVAYSIARLGKEQGVCQLVFSQVPFEAEFQLKANNITNYLEARGSRGIRMAADAFLFICRHNGRHKNGDLDPALFNSTVFQTAKLRETGHKDWFAYKYNPAYYRLTTELVADRAEVGMDAWFDEKPPEGVPF